MRRIAHITLAAARTAAARRRGTLWAGLALAAIAAAVPALLPARHAGPVPAAEASASAPSTSGGQDAPAGGTQGGAVTPQGPAATGPFTLLPGPPQTQPPRTRTRRHRVRVRHGLRYRRYWDASGRVRALRLDLYSPRPRTAAGRHAKKRERVRPAVVLVHGGGYCHGWRGDPKMVALARALARHGIVAASIDYRLLARPCATPLTQFPRGYGYAARASAADARAAIRWLRARAQKLGIDPRRIGIGGASAGAVTALLVELGSPRAAAHASITSSGAVRAAVVISGALPERHPPISREDPPVLMFHGTLDPIVPYDWARDDARALRDAGVRARLDTLTGAGHVPWSRYGRLFVRDSVRFFKRTLRRRRGPLAARR